MKKSGILIGGAGIIALGTAITLWQGFIEAFGPDGSPIFQAFKSFGHGAGYYVSAREATEKMSAHSRREYEITNDRGQKLRGFYYPCGERPSKKLVFFVHGYRSSHADAAGLMARSYMDRGFDIFGCDHVACGESEGDLVSFDYYESRDCLKWLDFLLDEFGRDISVVLHGFSMGGATVMKMSDRLPENVKFIVEDSGYTSGAELLKMNMGAAYPALNLMNRLISGFFLKETDVRPNLERCSLPILFVHGSADPVVPYEMGEELYGSYKGEKDCLFIPGGLHVEAAYQNLKEYMEKIDAFTEKYIG